MYKYACKRDLKASNIDTYILEIHAEDRTPWRQLIHSGIEVAEENIPKHETRKRKACAALPLSASHFVCVTVMYPKVGYTYKKDLQSCLLRHSRRCSPINENSRAHLHSLSRVSSANNK
ncbi:hypothetical protein DPMN_067419 [Dreissena polymorpha]|uniref:Uncharacterized protein n=1 Tax=Dreissena polymorpha TaxID=45954 RepID=A0A9D3YZ63_DREPO|nr:hypothetical protein DPMN_067419 [Dreissena polymorpha]